MASVRGKQEVASPWQRPYPQALRYARPSPIAHLTAHQLHGLLVCVRCHFQAGDYQATELTKWRAETWAMVCSSFLSHASATSPLAEATVGPSQHPKTPNLFLSVSQLTFHGGRISPWPELYYVDWASWLVNPRDPHMSLPPLTGIRITYHHAMPLFSNMGPEVQMQILMLERLAPYPLSYRCSPRHDFFFFFNSA